MYDYSTLERVYVGAWMVMYDACHVKFVLASGIGDVLKRDSEQWKVNGMRGARSLGVHDTLPNLTLYVEWQLLPQHVK